MLLTLREAETSIYLTLRVVSFAGKPRSNGLNGGGLSETQRGTVGAELAREAETSVYLTLREAKTSIYLTLRIVSFAGKPRSNGLNGLACPKPNAAL